MAACGVAMERTIPITLLALCAQSGQHDTEPDPADDLGTVANVDELADRLAHDPLIAIQAPCPEVQTVTTPSGPKIDPVDPWGVQLLTFQSNPKRPGYLCDVSCLLSTSQCWISSASDCHDSIPQPAQFPHAKRGQPSTLYVCVAASLASPIPLRETVTVTTSNDLEHPVTYYVRGVD